MSSEPGPRAGSRSTFSDVLQLRSEAEPPEGELQKPFSQAEPLPEPEPSSEPDELAAAAAVAAAAAPRMMLAVAAAACRRRVLVSEPSPEPESPESIVGSTEPPPE